MRRAGRWRPILALAALGAGCAPRPPIGGAVPGLQVVVPGDGVEFGMPFPLTVVRRWPEGSRVPPFDPTTLTPLVVVPAGQTRRSDGTRVEETLRFTARAFERGALTLTASFELPGAGGGAQVVTAPPTTLTVRSALAAAANANPAEAELPGDVLLEGGNRAVWMFAGVAALAAFGLWFARRRPRSTARATTPPPPPPPAIDHLAQARARLRALRQRPLPTADAIAALYIDATTVLRDDLAARSGLAAHEMTSEEILARAPNPQLARVLHAADLVKFARHAPTPAQAGAMLDAADASLDRQSGV